MTMHSALRRVFAPMLLLVWGLGGCTPASTETAPQPNPAEAPAYGDEIVSEAPALVPLDGAQVFDERVAHEVATPDEEAPVAEEMWSELEDLGLETDEDYEHALVCFDAPEIGCWRTGPVRELMKRAKREVNLTGGLRLEYPATAGLLTELAAVIERERHCCSFLTFALRVESEQQIIALEVTGGPGTRKFLRSH